MMMHSEHKHDEPKHDEPKKEPVKAKEPVKHTDIPKPPDALSDDIQKMLTKLGDQPRSAEITIAPGLTVVLGIRHTYFNADGSIAVVNNAHVAS